MLPGCASKNYPNGQHSPLANDSLGCAFGILCSCCICGPICQWCTLLHVLPTGALADLRLRAAIGKQIWRNEWNEVVKSHKTTGSILSKRTLLSVEAPTLTPSTRKSPVVGLGRHTTMRANRPKCRSSRTTEHTAKWSFSSWILQDMEAILFRTLTNFSWRNFAPDSYHF